LEVTESKKPSPRANSEVPAVGFVCNWDPVPQTTWSHTPWQLRSAMATKAKVHDLGVHLSRWERAAYKAAFTRRRGNRWVTEWKRSPLFEREVKARVRRALNARPCDVLIQVQDLATFPVPFLILQDLSYDVLLQQFERHGQVPHFPGLGLDMIRRLRDRQLAIYEQAAGLLAMSNWFARTLHEVSGVPEEKIAVVPPGRTARISTQQPCFRDRPRRRLLMVGKDFLTKGGDLVIAAVRNLRNSGMGDLTVTVAGPSVWPLAGPIPDWVDFRGRISATEVAHLFQSHDLLVMPSRMEGFGIVFVEALAHGMPVVARDAFAMTEIVRQTGGGVLVPDNDDPHQLAIAVAHALDDDALYEHCAANAAAVAEYFSWDRAAKDTLTVARRVVGP
jgi:glycosyltransferase involved in cell wall biosynthesis